MVNRSEKVANILGGCAIIIEGKNCKIWPAGLRLERIRIKEFLLVIHCFEESLVGLVEGYGVDVVERDLDFIQQQ